MRSVGRPMVTKIGKVQTIIDFHWNDFLMIQIWQNIIVATGYLAHTSFDISWGVLDNLEDLPILTLCRWCVVFLYRENDWCC